MYEARLQSLSISPLGCCFKKAYKLNTGSGISALGFGTWQPQPNEVETVVEIALWKGYSLGVATKFENTWHHRVADGIDSSLELDWDFKTWQEMQKLHATGKVRSVGTLANDPSTAARMPCHSKNLCGTNLSKIIPAVNQIELHSNNPSPKLVAYNSAKGIRTTGYSYLACNHIEVNFELHCWESTDEEAKQLDKPPDIFRVC
ncbi:NADP-dependent oxidoreductase domain-containing protein [Bisporella sp. PMI_857]|nr:NADP-dependent oxidoreductase domain-containing protein [Bisporella sp. PMI_857]